MKKLILLLLLIPILSFCQVTTFNEIDNINGIQDFQRTLIEKGYSFYDSSQFFGTEREADKWKVYVFDPSSYYMAGMGIDLYTAFGQEGVKSVMFFTFPAFIFPQLYDRISSHIKNTFEFTQITQDVYAWYNTENPKVQYGITKDSAGFGWIIKMVLE